MSSVTKRGPVKPSMNITPLIDVVFLLIVFFMIVNNIVTDEVPELQLPDLIDPETYQVDGKGRVIINVIPEQLYEPDNDGRMGPGHPEKQVLTRSGSPRAVSIGSNEFVITEEGALKAFQELCTQTIAQRYETNGEPPMIMLRVDAAVYYNSVLPIMNIIQVSMGEALEPEVAANTPLHLVAYLED